MDERSVLSINNVSKIFPGVKALDDVSIKAYGGEVLGLIGVNGAGKSTLMNILGGVYGMTSGSVTYNNELLRLKTPKDAEKYGIGFIHQEPVMFQYMTVAENILISKMNGVVNHKELNEEAQKYLNMLECNIDPRKKVGELPIGQRQMVEIARALSCGGKVILFDEPTASFTEKETEQLFEVIEKLKKSGAIVIFISHFLDEIERICDRIVVMRDGKVVISGRKSEITKEIIIKNMIRGELVKSSGIKSNSDEILFKAENINRGIVLHNVSFELRKGEIVGLWGLMGSGRTELLRAIYGLDKVDTGKLYIKNDENSKLEAISFNEIKEYCGYVTEDRHDDGIFLPWTIWENICAPNMKKFLRKGFLDYKEQKKEADDFVKLLNIKAKDVDVKAEQLSGGNQQKVIMAKWLMKSPKIFLLDEPTRGVDVGAKAEIHKLIHKLASQGSTVLVVSSEMEEISELSDRIMIMNRGTIVKTMNMSDVVDKDTLMSYCV